MVVGCWCQCMLNDGQYPPSASALPDRAIEAPYGLQLLRSFARLAQLYVLENRIAMFLLAWFSFGNLETVARYCYSTLAQVDINGSEKSMEPPTINFRAKLFIL